MRAVVEVPCDERGYCDVGAGNSHMLNIQVVFLLKTSFLGDAERKEAKIFAGDADADRFLSGDCRNATQ